MVSCLVIVDARAWYSGVYEYWYSGCHGIWSIIRPSNCFGLSGSSAVWVETLNEVTGAGVAFLNVFVVARAMLEVLLADGSTTCDVIEACV